MSRKLSSSKRQQRELKVPRPHRRGNIKIPYEGWLEAAKVVLIEEGIGFVRVDRLAKRLKVTRGGFYYHFKNHNALLEGLLKLWRSQNRFVPENLDVSSPLSACRTLQALTYSLIHEQGFDPQFDMAVREWARISVPVSEVVDEIDDQRVGSLRQIFIGLGYAEKEAEVRAKVFYYHQIGYYTVGTQESVRLRESNLPVYLSVLCGEKYVQNASVSDTADKTALVA
jgi:Bacterial regulatory proteins, tetR family